MTYSLKIGDKLIRDLSNPRPDEIDLAAVEDRLRLIRRFSNDPRALTVHSHRNLVKLLARKSSEPEEVLDWCEHHDDHEAIIGDIPGPIKNIIREHTPVLMRIERKLDDAINLARTGKPSPGDEIRRKVHTYDKMAETIEWRFVLDQPPERWNAPVSFPDEIAFEILQEAMAIENSA